MDIYKCLVSNSTDTSNIHHLKLWVRAARNNLKWVKIQIIWLSALRVNRFSAESWTEAKILTEIPATNDEKSSIDEKISCSNWIISTFNFNNFSGLLWDIFKIQNCLATPKGSIWLLVKYLYLLCVGFARRGIWGQDGDCGLISWSTCDGGSVRVLLSLATCTHRSRSVDTGHHLWSFV